MTTASVGKQAAGQGGYGGLLWRAVAAAEDKLATHLRMYLHNTTIGDAAYVAIQLHHSGTQFSRFIS